MAQNIGDGLGEDPIDGREKELQDKQGDTYRQDQENTCHSFGSNVLQKAFHDIPPCRVVSLCP